MDEPRTQPADIAGERVVRVFISSTFRDMHAEREELTKRVFPELRKLCESRGVTWGEVDLRWGVTDEQKAEGKVLPICLAEIKGCQPYFIGILGERYGWVPREIPAELLALQPWLAEHRQRSVTELEILHGVLNDPAMAEHAFFYFRDPTYAQSREAPAAAFLELPDPEELAELGSVEAERRAADRRGKLEALKERVREAYRARQLKHPPREGYADPRALGELVREDLRAVIDHQFPEGSQPDALAREAAEHEGFARSRARLYVGREEYFSRLDEHAAGAGPPLVVLGESGGGKSALLANWVRRFRGEASGSTQPNELTESSPLVVQHFIGATPASTDWAAMLRRILGEIARHFAIQLEIPDKPDALRMAFANGLHRAAARGRVVLVLDGLNQLEDRDQAPDLAWLPREVPPNVRLVLSTLPGRALDELTRRGWPTLGVGPLSVEERRQLIPPYLKQYGKELSPERLERIARAEATSNPLYLRVLLEELRQWGDHFRLDDRIAHYLEAPAPDALYAKVLARWEDDYEQERPGLVREAMTLLWAARRGLSDEELCEALGSDGEPLPRALWSPLRLAAEASLVSRSGLVGFAHDYLRQAVEQRYVPALEARTAAHERLAEYFRPHPLGPRKVDELPWQLARAEAWRPLFAVLAEPAFFRAAWAANQFEVKTYWAEIEAKSPLRMLDAYREAIQGTRETDEFAWDVGLLLGDTGHPEEVLVIRRRLVERFRAAGDLANLQASLGNQAVILKDRGQLDEAMALHLEQQRICRQLGDLDSLQSSLGNQAVILRARGQLDEAMALHQEKERICRQLGNLDGVGASLNNQALILKDRGQLDEAMALHKEQERIYRQLGNLDGLQAGLGNQALILKARGQLDEAMALHKEEERICRQLGTLDGLQASLGSQALILQALGQLGEAMALHKEEERICRQLGSLDGIQRSLGNQAVILQARGQFDEAMAFLKEQERICRQLGNLDNLGASLGNQAVILQARGQLDEAMALLKEGEQICRQLGNVEGLAMSLANQAIMLGDDHQYGEALSLAQEAHRLAQESGFTVFAGQVQELVERMRRLV